MQEVNALLVIRVTCAYDPLYRLTAANYSTGNVFTYTYDAVGNRLTQTIITNTTVYTYDIANRLINVGGQAYSWDNNGNLLNDGTSTYAYDAANRLITVSGQSSVSSYQYNGLGDRVQQTVNGVPTTYTLDLNAGLTQVLADGTNTYLYGNGRIAQQSVTTTAYFLGDALGSVRQLANASGAVTLARSYQPYGSVMSSAGTGTSTYGFTGEQTDNTGLVFLRARYYGPTQGRFITADPSRQERNLYQYAASNPVTFSDPSGLLFWRWRGGSVGSFNKPLPYIAHNRYAHPWIEYWMEQENGGIWQTHLEFPGRNVLNIDVIVFDRIAPSTSLSPVFFSSPVMGQVYEIEPADYPERIVHGWGEVVTKWGMIHYGIPPFVHTGNLPLTDHWAVPRPLGPFAGAPYDWSTVRWQLGSRLSPFVQRGPVRVDPNSLGLSGIPNAYWIILVTDGLIIYADEQSLIRAGAVSTVAITKKLLDKYQNARERPDGRGLPAPAPVFQWVPETISPGETCSPPGIPDDWIPVQPSLPCWNCG